MNKEYEVIGFGGDDSYSDDDYPDSPFNQLEDDDDEDSEEDKAFQKLTKTNTDYNSISKNLQEPKEGEVKKVIEPLKLGKQVFDDKGNKKTLFVSVTPFGDQTAVKNKINVNGIKAHVAKEIRTNGHGSNSETLGKSESEKNSTPIEKVKPFVEKTETIMNGSVVHQTPNEMNGDVVKNEKSENSLGIVKLNNGDASNKVTNEKSLKRSQPLDKNFKFRLIKDFHRENEKPSELCEKEENLTKSDKIKTSDKVSTLIDKAKKKVNQFPVITDNSNFKFKTKDFTNSCTKKTVENNKAVVLDIYNIQEKEDVKTNNEVNEEKTIKEVLTSSEKNNKIAGKEIRSEILETLAPENRNSNDSTTSLLTTDVEDKRDKVESGLNIDRSKLIPNVSSLYRHHLKKASPQKDEADIEARIPIVKPLMNGVVSSMTLVPSIECKFQENEETSCNVEHQLRKVSSEVSNVLKVEEISQKANKNLEDSEEELPKEIKFKKISFGSVDEFDKIIKDEEVILFSVDKGIDFTNCSREEENSSEGFGSVSKKERNGQLCSGDSPAPPALPTRPPPPLLESRTPFLQDFPNDEDAVKMTLEKPKVPTKPILVQSKRTNFQSPVHTVSHQNIFFFLAA